MNALTLAALAAGGLILYNLRPYTPPKKALPYMVTFTQAEIENGLPPLLLVRMAQQESNFDPHAVSPVGAQGIMQIMPKYHPNIDTFNPYDSIRYAGRYIRELFDEFGTWERALMAYNWGRGNVRNYLQKGTIKMPRETYLYFTKILRDVGA